MSASNSRIIWWVKPWMRNRWPFLYLLVLNDLGHKWQGAELDLAICKFLTCRLQLLRSWNLAPQKVHVKSPSAVLIVPLRNKKDHFTKLFSHQGLRFSWLCAFLGRRYLRALCWHVCYNWNAGWNAFHKTYMWKVHPKSLLCLKKTKTITALVNSWCTLGLQS